MANKLTEQTSLPLARCVVPASPEAAYAMALRALQGHGTIDRAGLVESLAAIKEDVQRLADGDMDAARTSLARMAVLSQAAAIRYSTLAEQWNGSSGEIEARSSLMRVALASIRTHAQCIAALASLEVRHVRED